MGDKLAHIRIDNCFGQLLTGNENLLLQLWRALRFRERGYFHSRLYKQKLWDGYIDFFKRETGKFLTGLLPEIEMALNLWKVEYTIEDNRNPLQFKVSEIDEHFFDQWTPKGQKKVCLYDYQVELINHAIQNRRGVIQAPTSSGKTNIMIGILKALPENTPTLILANKKSLVEQNYDEMMKWGFKNVGRLYDKYKEPSMFTCATVQSLHKIEKLLPKIRCLIVDEVHDMMSKIPRKFYGKMTSCSARIAVSATPFKFGGTHKTQKYAVKGYFGPIVKAKSAGETGVLTTKKLQERNILSASQCTFYPILTPQLPYDIYLDAVTHGISENWEFHQLVTRLAKQQKGRTLILVERLAHGDTLAGMIPGSLWVQGKDNLQTRKYIIGELQKSKKDITAIATHGIFNAGINVFLHSLINAAGGQADHQIIQRMGRGLRTADDKEILHYYDFIFKINDYLLEHSKKRIKILKQEGHEVIIKDEIDF